MQERKYGPRIPAPWRKRGYDSLLRIRLRWNHPSLYFAPPSFWTLTSPQPLTLFNVLRSGFLWLIAGQLVPLPDRFCRTVRICGSLVLFYGRDWGLMEAFWKSLVRVGAVGSCWSRRRFRIYGNSISLVLSSMVPSSWDYGLRVKRVQDAKTFKFV